MKPSNKHMKETLKMGQQSLKALLDIIDP